MFHETFFFVLCVSSLVGSVVCVDMTNTNELHPTFTHLPPKKTSTMATFEKAFEHDDFRYLVLQLGHSRPSESEMFTVLKKRTVVGSIDYVYKFFSLDDVESQDEFEMSVDFYKHAHQQKYGAAFEESLFEPSKGGVIVTERLVGTELSHIEKMSVDIQIDVATLLWKMASNGILCADMTSYNIMVCEKQSYFIDCDANWLIGKKSNELDSNLCFFVMAFILACHMRKNDKYIMWDLLRSMMVLKVQVILEDIISVMNKSKRLRRIALHYSYSKTALSDDDIIDLADNRGAGNVFDADAIRYMLRGKAKVSLNDVYRMVRIPGRSVVIPNFKRKRSSP